MKQKARSRSPADVGHNPTMTEPRYAMQIMQALVQTYVTLHHASNIVTIGGWPTRNTDTLLMRLTQTFQNTALLVICLFGVSLVHADTIRVPADQPTIQSAIDIAVTGDNILVSSGVYAERIDFSGKDIIVEGESGAAATTINGSAGGTVVRFDSGEPRTAVLRGFTITNGSANDGAGILISASSPTIEDNIITGNVACQGAGIKVTGSASSALIQRNTLTSNSKNGCATGYGGGINVDLSASAEIRNNTFSLNSNTYGAGIHLEGAGVVPITENDFFSNTAAAQGGAIATFNGADSLIQQNLMYNNAADEAGAIVINVPPAGPAPTIVSNTIFNNSINNITFGSGILVHGFPPSAVVRNNIVIATPGQSAIDCLVTGGTSVDIPEFRNNLVYSDGNLDFFGDCDGQSGMNGNLTGPASFVDGGNGDFRLQQASSAVDSAEADASIALDFAGNSRTVDGDDDQVAELDMGAFEAQPPAASAGPDQSVATSSAVALNASASSDADGIISTYAWVQTTGVAVSLSDAQAPQPAFTAPANADTLTFVLTVADDAAFSSSDTVVVTVTGGPPPQPPVANAGPDQTVDANSVVMLVGTGSSDPDGSITGYAWNQTSGTPVTLSDSQTVSPTFTAPSVGDTLSFELTVTDSQGLTDTDVVAITVTPPPVPPIADAGTDQSVDANDPVSLDGSGSFDPDGSIAGFSWSQIGGTTVTLSDTQTATPSFTAPSIGDTLTFEVTVTDNQGLTDGDSVVITVAPPPVPPVADAGIDQAVDAGSSVTLDGTGSTDADGSITDFAWSQTGGIAVTLSDSQSATPSFTAPSIGDTLSFEITVTDSQGLADSDDVQITVAPPPVPPVASAGIDQSVDSNSAVTLDGTASTDPDGSISSYAWNQISGTTVAVSNADTSTPSFTAPATSGSLTFVLTVTDDQGLTDSDEVLIAVTAPPPPQPPIADAGLDQTMEANSTVTMNGANSSDPDGTIVSYDWSQTAGTAVSLNGAQSVSPSFTAPGTADSLTFVLTVTDNSGLTDSDEIVVTVTATPPPPQPPVADAGVDQSVTTGELVTLNGSGSDDPDGTIVGYAWTQTAGSNVILSDALAPNPSFTAPGTSDSLTFTLTVTDDEGLTNADQIVVTVNDAPPPPQPPVANAGPDQSVGDGASVALDGSLSMDPDGSIASYIWTQITGTSVSLNSGQSATPSFTAPSMNESLTFVLTVTDNDGLTNSDEVVIAVTIAPPPAPPVASAGPDQSVSSSATVALDGSGSSDPDGTISVYSWGQISGMTVTLSDAQSATPNFVAPSAASTLTFVLTVTDDEGFMDSDEVLVTVSAPPIPPPPPTPSGGGGGGSVDLLAILALLLPIASGYGQQRRQARILA